MEKILAAILCFSLGITTVYAAPASLQQIDQSVKAYMETNQIPGAAVAIYYKGHAYTYVYGYANKASKKRVTRDTIFDLASISKIFTTTILASNVKAGRMKLTDPIVNYLPELSTTKNLPIDQVKIIHLATHTASFPRDVGGFGIEKNDRNALMQRLKTWQPPYPVNSKYLYSNVSFGLLGVAQEGATGKSYQTLLNQNVLQPLHMRHTFVYVPKQQSQLVAQGYNLLSEPAKPYQPTYLLGGGALRSSISDMLLFLQANLGLAPNAHSKSLLASMQFAQQAQFKVRDNFVLALGWQRITRNGQTFITKNGANIGFTSFIGFSPEHQFGVVVLFNKKATKAGKVGNQILNQLAKN